MVRGEYADRTVGTVKKHIGRATRNRDLEAKGELQQKRGRGKRLARKVKGKLP